MRRVALLVAALSLALASQASAGSYDVVACTGAPGHANASWSYYSTQYLYVAVGDECPAEAGSPSESTTAIEDGLWAADVLGLSSSAPDGTRGGWEFTAPPGTAISRLRYRRYGGRRGGNWDPRLTVDGAPVPGERCPLNRSFCSFGNPYPGFLKDIGGLSASVVRFELACTALYPGEQCGGGAFLHEGWASLYSATVTLSDPTPPRVSAETPSGWVRGEVTVPVTASDVGGGLAAIELRDGSTTRASAVFACDVTRPTPCPSTASPALTVPTTLLPDGERTVEVRARDAGGESAAVERTLRVDNSPPSAPSLTPTPAAGAWQATRDFSVTVARGGVEASPIATVLSTTCAETTEVCEPTRATAPGDALAVTLPDDGAHRLRVWLRDEAGNVDASRVAEVRLLADTAPPPAVGGLGASGGPSSWQVGWRADPQAASPERYLLEVCDPSGRCEARDLGDQRLTPVWTPTPGRWTATVRAVDATGATGPPSSVVLHHPEPAATTPTPVASPAPPAPALPTSPAAGPTADGERTSTSPSPRSPRLRIERARRGPTTIVARGRVDRRVDRTRLRVAARLTVPAGRARSRRVVTRPMSLRFDRRTGVWSARLRLGPTLRRSSQASVRARVAPHRAFRAATRARRVTRRR